MMNHISINKITYPVKTTTYSHTIKGLQYAEELAANLNNDFIDIDAVVQENKNGEWITEWTNI